MELGNRVAEPAQEQKPYKLWLLILMSIATFVGVSKLVRVFLFSFSTRELMYAVIALAVAVLLFIFSRR